MRMQITHSLGDLERDLRGMPKRASRHVREAVRHGAMTGNLIAKESARANSGRHGKHYPRSFTWDRPEPSLFGGVGWSSSYGPLSGRRQGGMSFEEGSRNQRPHNDLESSRDTAAGVVAQDIRSSLDDLFWAGRG